MELNRNNKYKTYDLQNHHYSNDTNSLNNVNEVDDTCYVLFTSGTTGKPKGVSISHFNIYSYLKIYEDSSIFSSVNILNGYKINNILGITSFSFDVSHNEITNSLMNGFTLVLADDNTCNNISKLAKYITENRAEYISTTPTRLNLFMENDDFKKSIKNIKMVNLIGEKLPNELCVNVNKYSECNIYNSYGPTECTVACSFKKIISDEKITIGKTICNYTMYILDKHLKPVPIGVEGEIFIGGYGVGKGYLNREDLTNERFIECPFNDDVNDKHNMKMYKTGDLGKWLSNGEIDYIGRNDFQVKIHGQRIELGEIESVIKEIDSIDHSVVIGNSLIRM
jgi:amino acid adenylation domain-containing protein